MHTTTIAATRADTRRGAGGGRLKTIRTQPWSLILVMLFALMVCLLAAAVIHPQAAYAEDDLVLERGDKLTKDKHIHLYYMRDQKTKRVLYCISPNFAQPEPDHTLLYNGRVMDWTSGKTPPGAGFEDNKTVQNRRLAARLDYIAYHGYFGDTTMKIGSVTGDANKLYLTTQLAINQALLDKKMPTRVFNDAAVTQDIDQASELLYNQAVAYAEDVVNHGGRHVEDHTALWFKNSDQSTTWQNIMTRDPRGKLRVQKTSADESITKDNPDYSLEGARFGIYTDDSCTPGKELEIITTDANGLATTAGELTCGDYWVKELTPSRGYAVSCDKVAVHIAGGPQTVLVQEPLGRGDISFDKVEEGSQRRMGNVVFRVTSKASGEWHLAKTDQQGHFSSQDHAHSHATNGLDAALLQDGTINEQELSDDYGLWFYGAQQQDSPSSAPIDDSQGAFPQGSYHFEEVGTSATLGHSLVSFDVDVRGGGSVASPGTISDPVVTLRTSAHDASDEDKYLSDTGERVLEDTVEYTGLIPGREYTLTCTLHDALTGAELTNDSGQPLTGKATFTPTQPKGNQTVRVAVGNLPQDVTRVVAYERLTQLGQLIACHEDPQDLEQTVYVPSIMTTLTDTHDSDHSIPADTVSALNDAVSYRGLIPGKSYRVEGKLVDQSNGKTLTNGKGSDLTASIDFVPSSSEGVVNVSFEVDASGLADHRIVAVETLSQDGTVICSHDSLDDSNQTVSVVRRLMSLPNTGSRTLVGSVAMGAFLVASATLCLLRRRRTDGSL